MKKLYPALTAMALVLALSTLVYAQSSTLLQLIQQAQSSLSGIAPSSLTAEGQATLSAIQADLEALKGMEAPVEPPPPPVEPPPSGLTDSLGKPVPDGWTEGDCDRMGYPAGWVYMTNQWQWGPPPFGDLDVDPRHMHMEGCLPALGVPVSGAITLHLKYVFFHWNNSPGAVFTEVEYQLKGLPYSAFSIGAGRKSSSPNRANFGTPLTAHMVTVYVPVRIDTSAETTDGIKGLVLRMGLKSPGRVVNPAIGKANPDDDLLTVQYPVTIANGGGRARLDQSEGFLITGWKTAWRFKPDPTTGSLEYREVNVSGYQDLRFSSTEPFKFFADDQATAWTVRSGLPPGRLPGLMSVLLNPDFHQHPPSYGTALQGPDGVPVFNMPTFSSKTAFTALVPSGIVPSDRVVFRVLDQKPGDPEGAYATLFGFKLGKVRP